MPGRVAQVWPVDEYPSPLFACDGSGFSCIGAGFQIHLGAQVENLAGAAHATPAAAGAQGLGRFRMRTWRGLSGLRSRRPRPVSYRPARASCWLSSSTTSSQLRSAKSAKRRGVGPNSVLWHFWHPYEGHVFSTIFCARRRRKTVYVY